MHVSSVLPTRPGAVNASRAVPANSEAPCETINRLPRGLVITVTTIKMTYIYYNIVIIETTKLIDVFETSNN